MQVGEKVSQVGCKMSICMRSRRPVPREYADAIEEVDISAGTSTKVKRISQYNRTQHFAIQQSTIFRNTIEHSVSQRFGAAVC